MDKAAEFGSVIDAGVEGVERQWGIHAAVLLVESCSGGDVCLDCWTLMTVAREQWATWIVVVENNFGVVLFELINRSNPREHRKHILGSKEINILSNEEDSYFFCIEDSGSVQVGLSLASWDFAVKPIFVIAKLFPENSLGMNNKKCIPCNNGYDARHRVGLRLLATCRDVRPFATLSSLAAALQLLTAAALQLYAAVTLQLDSVCA